MGGGGYVTHLVNNKQVTFLQIFPLAFLASLMSSFCTFLLSFVSPLASALLLIFHSFVSCEVPFSHFGRLLSFSFFLVVLPTDINIQNLDYCKNYALVKLSQHLLAALVLIIVCTIYIGHLVWGYATPLASVQSTAGNVCTLHYVEKRLQVVNYCS